jgi:hypothetical protein
MNYSKAIRSLSIVGLVAASALNGCAADSQSGEESVDFTKQAYTQVPGDAGFVWSSSLTGSSDAASGFSYNSSGGTNRITQIATGQYRVDFPGLGNTTGGDVQVTAYGSGTERCKVAGWTSSGSTLQVNVFCFTSVGAPTNALFEANYVRRSDFPGAEGGYVWAFDPSSSSYNAASSWSWNSTGGAVTISHTPGTGSYSVSLAGQNLAGGTVEVTAYGSSNSYCKVASWSGANINVVCFNGSNGAPIESTFDLLFSTKSPNGTPSSTYAWADQPTASSYHPNANYERGLLNVDTNSQPVVVSTPATVTRSSVGRYRVQFPSMASIVTNPSNVKVTGYSTGSDTCKVVDWFTSNGDGFADVACFSASGTPMDALYTITYSSFAYAIARANSPGCVSPPASFVSRPEPSFFAGRVSQSRKLPALVPSRRDEISVSDTEKHSR